MANFISSIGIVLFSLLLISEVIGHSYLTSPISRSDQTQSESGCRGPACLGPCDLPLASATRAPITIQRGANILAQWPRNNHAGGFIRFAWAQTSQSDSASAFDSGVSTIHCHEIGGCGPSDPTNPNGGDSNPGNGAFGACQVNITVPLSLSNGEYTLQWAWFGGAFALGDYYSCVDYTISGGPTGAVATPLYYGGDYSNPGQNVCKFFNTDRLHECVDEPCSNPIYPDSQQETGPAYGIAIAGSSSSSSPSPSPAPTPSPTPSPSPVPSTTNHVTSYSVISQKLTTQSAQVPNSITTHSKSNSALTTGRKSMTSGVAPAPSPNPITPSANCAGVSVISSSSAIMSEVDTWPGQLHAIITITIEEAMLSNWYLELTWPSSSSPSSVLSVYNSGSLLCQSTSSAIFRPIASWAATVYSGTVLSVEIIASNPNGWTPQYISENTQLMVFTS